MLVKFDNITYEPTEAGAKLDHAVTGFKWLDNEFGKIRLMAGDIHIGTMSIHQKLEPMTIEQVIKDNSDLLVTGNKALDIDETKKLKVRNLSTNERLAMALVVTNAIRSIAHILPPYYEADLKCAFEVVLNLAGKRN